MPSFGDHDPELAGSSPSTQRYVAEIVDSLFLVGPAEFFAVELPADPPGARAVHLLGTVTVTDKKGDIQVRLFRAPDYKAWLKKRGGEKAGAFWTSALETHRPDQDRLLPVRSSSCSTTAIRCGPASTSGPDADPVRVDRRPSDRGDAGQQRGGSIEDDIITPRANTEEGISRLRRPSPT